MRALVRLSIACVLALLVAAVARGVDVREPGAGALPPDDPIGGARRAAIEAVGWLERSVAAHLGDGGTRVAPSPTAAIEVTYEGMLDYEAHYKHPYDVLRVRTRLVYLDAGPRTRRLDWTTFESDSDVVGSTETILVLGDRVLRRPDRAQPFEQCSKGRAPEAEFLVGSGLPWALAADGITRPSGLRSIGVVTGPRPAGLRGGVRLHAVSGVQVGERSADLDLDVVAAHVRALEVPYPHPRLGDVTDWVAYERVARHNAIQVAESLAIRWHGLDESTRIRAGLRSVRVGVAAADSLVAPADVAPARADRDLEHPDPILVALAPRVWTVDVASVDSRAMIVEFADHLIALEAPRTTATGEAIVRLLRERLPGKPIRWALFGHYHPQYTGGLRAYAAAGATIACTPGNEQFVRDILARPYRLRPDALAALPPARGRGPAIEVFRGRRVFADSTNRLEAIDIGERSGHTDEYLVFHVPEPGIAFEGDLGWFTVNGVLRASRRAQGMVEALEQEDVHPRRYAQSWPVAGNPATVSADTLRALIEARNRP